LQNTASNSAEKKNRPREGAEEGGFGGNFAAPSLPRRKFFAAECRIP